MSVNLVRKSRLSLFIFYFFGLLMIYNCHSAIIPSVSVIQIRTYGLISVPFSIRRPFNFSSAHAGRTAKWLSLLFYTASYYRVRLSSVGLARMLIRSASHRRIRAHDIGPICSIIAWQSLYYSLGSSLILGHH